MLGSSVHSKEEVLRRYRIPNWAHQIFDRPFLACGSVVSTIVQKFQVKPTCSMGFGGIECVSVQYKAIHRPTAKEPFRLLLLHGMREFRCKALSNGRNQTLTIVNLVFCKRVNWTEAQRRLTKNDSPYRSLSECHFALVSTLEYSPFYSIWFLQKLECTG